MPPALPITFADDADRAKVPDLSQVNDLASIGHPHIDRPGRHDLIKYLGRVLPRSGLKSAAAATLLEDLADRAVRSEFEPVLCLEAPEAAVVPRSWPWKSACPRQWRAASDSPRRGRSAQIRSGSSTR